MKTGKLAALLLSAATLCATAEARSLSDPATPGTRSYTYRVIEIVNGKTSHGYRTNFDLVTGSDGSIDAVVRSTEQSADGTNWTAVTATDECKTAMRAPAGALAQVRLWPIKAGAAKGLGPDFLDTCAPPAVFFPLTDILNVAIIPVSPSFKVQNLKGPGDKAHYEGFTASYDRDGEAIEETSQGGDVTFAALSDGKAVIDWVTAPADLDLDTKSGAQPMRLSGKEHWAFRVTLDANTGALMEAHTTFDNLDLVAHLPGVPDDKAPPVKISRTVQITSR